MTNLPSVAAVVGHSDEIELLEACIAHHERIGVRHFLVSADADAVRGQHGLAELASRENVRVVYREESDADGFHFLTNAVAATVAWTRPDRILLIDSDEFCVAASGDLRTAPELDAGVLQLSRFNVPLQRDAHGGTRPLDVAQPSELPLIVRPQPADLRDLSETMSPPWIMSPIAPKLIVRPSAIDAVLTGGHSARTHDADLQPRLAHDVCVVHVPFTTFERFRRKVERIRTGLIRLGHLFKDDEALHWKRWAAIAERGRLDAEFERQIFGAAEFGALAANGTIATAEQLFRTAGGALSR